MSELSLLRVLLVFSLAVAPLGTHAFFLPERSALHVAAYAVGLACAAASLFTPASVLSVGWLALCAGSFAVFLWGRLRALGLAGMRSLPVLAACVPFLFSNIAAVWLVAGTNDLRLLGYGPEFSFYAALHGNVLGWMLVGALAILVHLGHARRFYVSAVVVCFASFLLIALGIDQLRALKPIGVVGLTLAVPASQLVFLRSVWTRHAAAFVLGATSLAGLLFTMALAWANHVGAPLVTELAGLRGMVSAHGVLNALVVAPCFLLAVALHARRLAAEGSTRAAP